MNPYVQEWIWVYSKARGVAKYVLLAIGRRIEATKRGFETDPLPLEAIATDTGLADSTVREHIKALSGPTGELEVVKAPRRGEVHRYKLRRELQLPLIDMQPARVRRRLAAVTAPDTGGEASIASTPPPGGDSAESQRRQSAVAGVEAISFSEDVRTEISTSSYEQEKAAAEFIRWFYAEFKHRRGYPYHVPDGLRGKAVNVVADLLTGRTVERLQVMAQWMFAAERDAWIVASDYSLFVLNQKAAYLEGVVVANDGRGPDDGVLQEAAH